MTQIDRDTDALVGEWLTLRQAAAALNVSPNRVKQMIREHKLLGATRAGEVSVPAAFVVDGTTPKGLQGTLTLLADSGLTEEEALRWMFTADDSLPGTPIEAIRSNRGTEVRRRAQALLL
ncbi:helix-turn-helix domain-containing protein [Thermobifida halotolerans]|uniref:Helix-turn-helix domain-containing protein n=1 Tax=Thermobifida halotolerans TaxID=483545 RepID=A0A399G5B4_9ACTN|nr:Rv2175c family DNA-binding protein [Thermobifida halotolerans]UOE20157.1 helix-turn-helix domain-containing protein [Thermobifida halotolerans]